MSEPKRYKLRPIFWDYIQTKSVSKDQIDAMGNESAYSHKDGEYVLHSDYARLQAEVERLHKAGNAMASSIQFNEEMAQDYNGPTIVHQSVQHWNAAKEGKPSV